MTSAPVLRFGSVCSGIEAASAAWNPLGWRAAWFSEIDKFPSAVLAHHYPDIPNRGDMTKFKDWDDAAIDVLVGGTPCQSFSVAGLRKGLDDPRGNLMLTYLAIAGRYRPRRLVWENVPGVLSIDSGRAFGTFLGGLAQLGYGFAYRVLDAQFCGVPQRRRRVFVVGCLGDWRRAAAVLFERASLRGDPAPSRKAGQRVAGAVTQRIDRGGVNSEGGDEHLIPAMHSEVSPALKARDGKGPSSDGDGDGDGAILVPMIAHALRGEGFDASEDDTGRGTPLVPIAFDCKASGQSGFGVGEIASTQRAMGHANSHQNAGGHQAVMSGMQVRRLTPRECERLQGFPDDYTLLPGRTADGPRYKALGNSMAVPVMRWIGERIQQLDSLSIREVA